MKYRVLLALAGIVAGWIVVITFQYPGSMVSPGTLLPGHVELSTDCFACHVPLLGVSSKKCTSCHSVDDIGLRTTTGEPITRPEAVLSFHQNLIEQECTACHLDHTGTRLAHNPHGFAHELLQEELRSDCVGCHTAPEDDMHQTINGGCADCHDNQGWNRLRFDHDQLFLLDDDHNASCVTCHTDNVFTEFSCYGCHEHTPSRISRRHEREGIRDFENCVECHRNAHDEPEHGERRRENND